MPIGRGFFRERSGAGGATRTRLREAGHHAGWAAVRRIPEGRQRITAAFRRAAADPIAQPSIRRTSSRPGNFGSINDGSAEVVVVAVEIADDAAKGGFETLA